MSAKLNVGELLALALQQPEVQELLAQATERGAGRALQLREELKARGADAEGELALALQTPAGRAAIELALQQPSVQEAIAKERRGRAAEEEGRERVRRMRARAGTGR